MHQSVAILLSFVLTLVHGQKPGSSPIITGCKELRTYSYAYNNFYHLDESGDQGGTGNISIHVYVQAASNAHVLLSTVPFPKLTDPVYEIVLGGGQNTFSEIRRLQRTSTKFAKSTTGLLSGTELRGFWVRMYYTGMLEVGEEGNDLPFLFWKDTQQLKIRYFSFSTWTGVAGKFIFDCPLSGKRSQSNFLSEEDAARSQLVPSQLTTLERLRSDLLTNYDPYSRPVLHEDHYTTVYVHFSSHHVQLDEKKSSLRTHGTMSMKWIDEKIVWDPESYDNISFINLASHEAWLPELVLYNAAGHGADILDNAGLVVSSEGRARWAPQASLKSWCSRLDIWQWPRDEHSCSLRFGFWAQQQPRLLLQLDNDTKISKQKTGSEWEVVNLTSQIVWDTETWANGFTEHEKQLNEIPTSNLVIEMQLRRLDQSYNAILTAPFIVINVMTLLSFWMTPNNFTKTLFVCLALVISSMVAIILTDVVPVHTSHTPFIIAAYSRSMIAAVISLLLSVTTICLGRYNYVRPLPTILYKHVTSEHVCTIFFLPRINNKATTQYSQLDETRQNGNSNNIPQQEIQQQWTILAIFIDRICSVLFCIFMGIVLATC